jgi:hypothetical protein
MPRINLKRAQPIVKSYCAGLGLSYVECGLMDSYSQALRHLDAMGAIGAQRAPHDS